MLHTKSLDKVINHLRWDIDADDTRFRHVIKAFILRIG